MNNALFVFGIPTMLLAAFGLRRVPAHRVTSVHRFGRYRRTLGPGWHWIVPGLDRTRGEVDLVGHRLEVDGLAAGSGAELYYQIVEPEKAGEALERMDDWVAGQAREALQGKALSSDQLKSELNRRVARLGLRVIRCSLHAG